MTKSIVLSLPLQLVFPARNLGFQICPYYFFTSHKVCELGRFPTIFTAHKVEAHAAI
jgi:hypothetical protein